MKIWLNNQLQDAGDARIDPADRGLLLGDGLFETIACRHGKILRLPRHLARLRQGCALLRLDLPAVDWHHILDTTLQANGLTDAVLRLTVTSGKAAANQRGLRTETAPMPTMLVTAAPLPPPAAPASCIIAQSTRRNHLSPLAAIKSTNYLDNMLARQEATNQNADDAILLNMYGHVTEATASNLFIVRSGQLITPPISDGALPGTMRAAIIDAHPVTQRSLTPEDIITADHLFLTSSLGLRQVRKINHRVFDQNANRLDTTGWMELA